MVEVFKTNVQYVEQSVRLISKLQQQFQELKICFDLEDCDKILRVEGAPISVEGIILLLHTEGYECAILS